MNYADLVPLIQVSAMGAPQPLVLAKIAEVAEEFCRLSRIYVVAPAATVLTANQKNVTFTPPTGTYLLEVAGAKLNGVPLKYRPESELVENWEALTGDPTNYLVEGNSVRVVPYPAVTTTHQVRVKYTVAPLLSTRTLDDVVAIPWQTALIHGAKAKLLSHPKADWADSAAAGIEYAEYQRLVNEARIRARNQGSSEIQLRVRPRFA